jgi:acyl-coenzyme A thioesterase PaaI-like protein
MLSWESKLSAIDAGQESFDTCFACGRDNPVGLKLRFVRGPGEARCEFTISKHYEGWDGVVHGGIVCTILDEAMAHAYFPETKGLTAKAEFRFRQPARVGVPMVVTGRLVKRTRKLLTTEAVIRLEDGTVVAEGIAQAYVVGRGRALSEST